MDPISARTLRNWLLELADRKSISFLISSHDLDSISELSDQVVLLSQGKVVENISKADVGEEGGTGTWTGRVEMIREKLRNDQVGQGNVIQMELS